MTKSEKIERWKSLEKWEWKGFLTEEETREFYSLCSELGAKRINENFGGWELPGTTKK